MKNKNDPEETVWLIKIVVMLFFICFFSYMSALEKPNPKVAVWGDTWECKSCGYENYEGINRCPICGTAKGSR